MARRWQDDDDPRIDAAEYERDYGGDYAAERAEARTDRRAYGE